MNKNILIDISRNLLKAWYLDVQFLVNLIDEHKLDFDDIYENVEMNFWKEIQFDINYYIYEALSQIAYKFINSNKKLFKKESDEFEIYTNYLDSHIWFSSRRVQYKFERFY
jgi:hypothetical protein